MGWNINNPIMLVTAFLLGLEIMIIQVGAQEPSSSTVTTLISTDYQLNCQNSTNCSTDATTESTPQKNETTPVSTTIMPNITTPNVTIVPKLNDTHRINVTKTSKKIYKEEDHVMDFCPCDLKMKICDINCCCDMDCSKEKKEVFTHCDDIVERHYDTRMCDYFEYIYVNKSASIWHINQNSLLCVMATNKPKSFPVNKPLFTNPEHVDFRMLKQHQWHHYTESQFEFRLLIKKFLYGDQMWLLTDKFSATELVIPTQFVTLACNTNTPVKYLENIKTKCLRMVSGEPENDIFMQMEKYYQGARVVGAPHLINSTARIENFKNCSSNVCIEIQPRVCNEDFSKCEALIKNSTPQIRHEFIFSKKMYCNAVKKVWYKIYHNGTNGIVNVSVLFNLRNLTLDEYPKTTYYMQEFEVTFSWYNETAFNLSNFRSGNPGYLYGNPIVIGHLRTEKSANESSPRLTILRNSSEIFDKFLVLPKPKDGFCVLDKTSYTIVNFGYNTRLKCKISELLRKQVNETATSLCRRLQKTIFRYWSVKVNASYNTSVCKWGNANVTNLQDWKEVTYNHKPEEIIAQINGSWNDPRNETVFCHNITTDLFINIFHYRFDYNTLANQEKILGVSFNFNDLKNVSVTEYSKDQGLLFSTDTVIDVQHFDLTAERRKKFVGPPSLKIKLPYDFFYPFVKIGSHGETLNYFVSLLLCTYFITILF